MRLKLFEEKKNRKIGMIIVVISIVLLAAAIFVCRTYFIYEERQKESVLDQINDSIYAFTIENGTGNKTMSNTIPEGKDYEVTVDCTDGAVGSWDYESWGPIITNLISTRTKCYINFRGQYQEEILHGTAPVLKDGLIPVTIDEDGVVHKANVYDEWYSYANQEWANAVILEDESVSYENYEEIPEENIESYFVWIPRYKYKLFNLGNYTSLTSINNNAVQTIDVVFGTDTTDDSREGECTTPMVSGETGNCKVGDYMSHPAFLAFDVNGIWVGKFETGYKGATSASEAQKNEANSDKIQIKPNVYSWRNVRPAETFASSYDYKREYDSHLIKNTEWGAVAYLQHSVYGSRASVRNNNNSNYITGYAAKNEPTIGYTATNETGNKYEGTSLGVDGTYTYNYKNPLSVVASTTNNYSGVYDMSGGAWEYTMGVMINSSGVPVSGNSSSKNSGFNGPYSNATGSYTAGIDFPEAKYYDKYVYSTANVAFNQRILGDATGEMGPFASATYSDQIRQIGSWYRDEARFIYFENPWFTRGGRYIYGNGTGVFSFNSTVGSIFTSYGFRVVLAF